VPAHLAQDVLGAHEVGVPLAQEERPVARPRLFVGDAGEDHVAPQPGARPLQQHERHQRHRDHVLHVDRAAAPDVAALFDRRERIVLPALALGRHDVEVAVEQERPALALAAQPRHHAGAPRIALDDRVLDALGLEHARDVVGRGALVARGVGRVNSQERLEMTHGLFGRPRPVDGRVHGAEGWGGCLPVASDFGTQRATPSEQMSRALRKPSVKAQKGAKQGCGVCAKGAKRSWHSTAPLWRRAARLRCSACQNACIGLFALIMAASRAGLTLVALALASDDDKKVIVSLGSISPWPQAEGGPAVWAVLHHDDSSFGNEKRR
jgi:hypothetical protein